MMINALTANRIAEHAQSEKRAREEKAMENTVELVCEKIKVAAEAGRTECLISIKDCEIKHPHCVATYLNEKLGYEAEFIAKIKSIRITWNNPRV